MTPPGACTAALNWYRAVPWGGRTGTVAVPTLMVWGHGDKFIVESAVRRSENRVTSDFRFDELPGSHWIPDQQPDAVAELLAGWFARS